MRLMSKNNVIIITGLSGAGRTTALKILEDIGYEAIDNLPTSLIINILESNIKKNIAVGIDIRSQGFNAKKIADLKGKIKRMVVKDWEGVWAESVSSIHVETFEEILNIFNEGGARRDPGSGYLQ